VYRVEKLFREKDSEELRLNEEVHYIEGEIDDWLVASVPETTSAASAKMTQDRIQAATNRPVLIITHNIEFMRAVKLTPAEAAKVIGRAEKDIEAQNARDQATLDELEREERESERDEDGEGDGDSPGVCEEDGGVEEGSGADA